VGCLLLSISAAGPSSCSEEVPYIQTPANVVEAMLSLAQVGPQDYVVDLGSGDGRIVIAAAKRYGARGLGIDYDSALIAKSRAAAEKAGVSDRVAFLMQDIFDADFRAATAVTMYLLPEVNLQLRPRLLFELRPGTRVVSHDWDMGDWTPDRQLTVDAPEKPVGHKKESTIYLWIIPARIAGYWRGTIEGPEGEEPVTIEFFQRFQNTSATAWTRRRTLAGQGRLQGDTLSLILDRLPPIPYVPPLHFFLRISGGHLEGEAHDSSRRYKLRATRISD
jgi:SAM-dependent methyltransferase